MVSWIISRIVVLAFGTLYPAYSSYKAVKTKNVKEYGWKSPTPFNTAYGSEIREVKWMMYWIVFAFFTTAETITDIVLSWFPFYFELKIAFVIWLLSPYTKGSSVLYRKFVHPTLSNKEKEIDEYISQARDRSYETMMRFGKRGLNLAANAAVTAATKGQGVLSEKLRSFSMQDLTLIRDEEELHLDHRMRSSTVGLHDTMDDMSVGAPRKMVTRQARSVASEDLYRSDGDPTDSRTEQSDDDTGEKGLKRNASIKVVKKPPVAKAETQPKAVKKQPKKKATPAANSNGETP